MPQPELLLTPHGPALAPRYREAAARTPHPNRATTPAHRSAEAACPVPPHPDEAADPVPPHSDEAAARVSPSAGTAAPPRRLPATAGRARISPSTGTAAPPRRLPATAGGAANAYLRLFSLPGARAFTVGNLIARLPAGMFGVSAVVMIAGTYGSYALAGAVGAAGLAAGALAAPWIARLVDRHGQARVAVPATVWAVLGQLALLLCAHAQAPAWTLFAAAVLGATAPNTGGMSRARWAHLLKDDPGALHTANAFEQAADELCFMLGPVLAALLCSALFPEAGTLAAAVLFLSGMLLFAAQRATEPPAARTPGAARRCAPRACPRCSRCSSPRERSSARWRWSRSRTSTGPWRARCSPSRPRVPPWPAWSTAGPAAPRRSPPASP
ncbi:MFS transporter [Streptomyces roseicoloratus]|uniref:MFS transporter n=1 Tax=Streptomyces roseicoloratus TaxID=2508722 RepID=A0ABY9RX60_9ACTN|nr:MFS transporter [Streptomyces roseicoloratus]WMX46762.1 MFS transporter [Streptomyces roseicoloratus]